MTDDGRDPVFDVPCKTCGAKAGDECRFVNDRRNGARRGDSMGRSVHGRRLKAAGVL